MEQLENTNRDLHLTTERMRTVEAQRIAAAKEVELQRLQVTESSAVPKGFCCSQHCFSRSSHTWTGRGARCRPL
jgi:hypothetical protein